MEALWLAAHFPTLGFENHCRAAADGTSDRPMALVENRRIVQVNAPAERLGLETGTTLATAVAIVDELAYFERDLDEERRRLAWLGLACYRYSSRVSVEPPAGLLVEAGGSSQLFGGLRTLAEELDCRFRRLGHAANIAVAATPAAATALARTNEGVFLAEDAAAALHRVPLACADVSERHLERLANMGLRSLGQLLALPQQEVGKRFGHDLVDYLARLRGSKADPRECIEPPERFRSALHLPESVDDKEALSFPMRRLADELGAWLAARQFGIEALTWEFKPLRGDAATLAVRFAEPTAEQTAFLALSRLRLERAELPREVMSIALAADSPTPFMPPAADLLAKRQAAMSRAELADRLAARLGDDAIQTLQTIDDHRPERAWALLPAAAGARRDKARTEAASKAAAANAAVENSDASTKRRPLWLLDVPKPVAIEDFTLLAGPERIETGWWDGAEHRLSRDYFVAIAKSGAQCWIYRQGTGSLHARGSPSRTARLRAAPAEGSFMRGASPSRTPAEGSFMRGASPSRTPAEGSFMRGASPSRTPAEGSFMRGASPSRTPAEGSFMRGASPSRTPAEGSFMRGASPSRTPAEGSHARGSPSRTLAEGSANEHERKDCKWHLHGYFS